MMNLVQDQPRSRAARAALDPEPGAIPVGVLADHAESVAPPAWQVLRALVELRRGGPALPQQQAARLGELCRMVCDLHRIRIEVLGQLPRSPAIVVANHLGYI